MHDLKEKDLSARKRQTGQTKISISPSIAQKRLSDIIFDADACAINPTLSGLRKFIRVGDFMWH